MVLKLTIVAGLPGSGKSTYLKKLKEGGQVDVVYDDFQADSVEKDPNPFLSKHYGSLVANLRRGKSAAVADIRYVDPQELRILMSAVAAAVPWTTFDIKYFENNPEKCRTNVLKRARKNTKYEFGLIDKWSPRYKKLRPDYTEIPVRG